MTDQEKKSLRSFLKEMEDAVKRYKEVKSEWPENSRVHIAASAQISTVYRLMESYLEKFSEDLFPTCERCNLPVSDEDSAGPGSNLHKECVKPCVHSDDCPMDYCVRGPNPKCHDYEPKEE